MPRYSLLVFCTDCGRTHSTKITLNLADGPNKRKTIAEAYEGKTLSPNVAKLFRKAILCPESGNSITLDDVDNLYLVPIA